MLWILDPRDPSPLHEQVARCVRDAVRAGDLRAGQHLPASRDVARDLGINMHTVLRAYQALQEDGLIDLRRGRGATVTPGASGLLEEGRDGAAVEGLRARARGLGAEAAAAGVDEEALAELAAALVEGHTEAIHAAGGVGVRTR